MAQKIYVPGAEPPVNDGERRVIEALENGLPPSFVIYPGVQVIHQGATDDIDILVLTDHNLVVVEVKDIVGHLVIDNGACFVNRNPRPQPFLATSGKARRLKSRLVDADPGLSTVWVAPLVVLARTPASLTITPDSLKSSIVGIEQAIAILTDPERLAKGTPVPLGDRKDRVREVLNLTSGRERGVRFGPYRCDELIHRSDDEDIWSAIHGVTGDAVEIRHIGRNPATRQKRVAEAEGELLALRRIGLHPSIDGPREVLPQDDGSIVLVHEPRQGPTLDDLLAGDLPIPVERILLDVTAAITRAHEQGVVHRRLAPRWIEVRDDGVVVRGFSLLADGAVPPAATVLVDEDAAFLAPEVVARQIAGKAADVYSIGALIGRLAPDDELLQRLATELTGPDAAKRRLPTDGYLLEALRLAFGVASKSPTPAPATPQPPKVDDKGRLLPGAAFGAYIVVDHLGTGGFSDVYLVQGDFGDRHTLKVFRGTDAVGFAEHEFAALRNIDDPHVVEVETAGVHPLGPYMVSEYLEGETLEERIDAGEDTRDIAQTLLIGYDLLGALDAIHAKGVIHRDVKPGNVILVEGRGGVLFDFGVAAVGGAGVNGVTFAYRPPGVPVGAADPDLDLFAAGVVLCELVMGRHPYPDRKPDGGEAPDLSTMPPGLAEVLGKAVDPDPAKRFGSAAEFMEALEPFVEVGAPVRVERRHLYRKVEQHIAAGEYDAAEAICLPEWKRLRQRIAIGRAAGAQPGSMIGGVRVAFAGEGSELVYTLDGAGREQAQTWTWHVTGATGLTIDVRLAEFADGTAQIATVDAYGSHDCFQELVNRLRHGIYLDGGEAVMRLRFTSRVDRVSQRKAESVAELSEHAGVDVAPILREAGARSVDTRAALGFGDPPRERNQIAVACPVAVRNEVMLRAYVLTVVVPLARQLGLLLDQS